MGLFGGWHKKKTSPKDGEAEGAPAHSNSSIQSSLEVGPKTSSVFEFGSAGAAGEEGFIIEGYCSVSNHLDACRWEFTHVPTVSDGASPLFRIIF